MLRQTLIISGLTRGKISKIYVKWWYTNREYYIYLRAIIFKIYFSFLRLVPLIFLDMLNCFNKFPNYSRYFSAESYYSTIFGDGPVFQTSFHLWNMFIPKRVIWSDPQFPPLKANPLKLTAQLFLPKKFSSYKRLKNEFKGGEEFQK